MQATGHWGAILGATLVIAGALGGAPVAIGSADATSAASDDAADGEDGDNEAPLPDAGLDQEVPVNATVYLDASGSRDPDGSIESYEWSIERPDGNNIEPDCPDCARTEFRVATNGTYEATVTVTDDDGETSSDTLYIQAAAVEGPSVELAGPTDVGAGLNTTYTATADSGDSPLMKVEWSVNGSEVAESETSGESATDDFRTAFESGTYTLAVRVVSERGRTDTATLTVDADRPLRPCPGATWNTTLSAWNTDPCSGSQVDSGPDLGRLDTAGSETNRTACLTYNQDDEDYAPNDPEHYCENDRLFGTSNLSLTDADQDGEITWGGVTFTQARLERLADEVDGVSLEPDGTELNFESIDAYQRAFGTTYANPLNDPTWTPNEITTYATQFPDNGDKYNNSNDNIATVLAVENQPGNEPGGIYNEPGPVIDSPEEVGGSDNDNTENSGDISSGNTGTATDESSNDDSRNAGSSGQENDKLPEFYQ